MHRKISLAITEDVFSINAQMNRVVTFGMLHHGQVVVSEFAALFKFRCLTPTFVLTSIWMAHYIYSDNQCEDDEKKVSHDAENNNIT